MTELKKLDANDIKSIKTLFYSVFSDEPWCDDWSDPVQLHNYIFDLVGNNNSLSLGLYENDVLVGISLGYIMHWCAGTEYYIFEFCVRPKDQGKGLGTAFFDMISDYAAQLGIDHIFLQTEKSVPAFGFYQKNGFTELEGHVSLVRRLDNKDNN